VLSGALRRGATEHRAMAQGPDAGTSGASGLGMVSRRALEHGSPESDTALVRDMVAGDPLAWRAFYARYDRLVLRCITRVTARYARYLGGDDIAEIYGTLQVQLCANGMAKLRSFDADRGRRLSSWIGLLAVNCAYDHLRALRREPRRAPLDEAEEIGAADPQPDEALELKERAQLVGEILGELSEKDREFIKLYFGEALPIEQIAERMSISVKTVYTKKHKIQSRIEARLSGYGLAA
jgi:RNA polymerase sigma-70 factor (ECF subfamily)